MNIAFSFNRKYIKYALVTMTSICLNNNCHVDFFLLHSELNDDDIIYIRDSLCEYDVTVIPVHIELDTLSMKLPVSEFWTSEIYYRLFLAEVLPAEVDRILYLDTDIIVHSSLDELYNTDFEDMDLCVCDDCNGSLNIEDMSEYQQSVFGEPIQNGYRYFNSGVMMMNISAMRGCITFNTYLDAIRTLDNKITAPDQDVLNYVHKFRVKYTDWKKYDLFARSAYNDGYDYNEMIKSNVIIHYAGNKPWNCKGLHYVYEKLWWEYAFKTKCCLELMEEFLDSSLTEGVYETEIVRLSGEYDLIDNTIKKAEQIMSRLGLADK